MRTIEQRILAFLTERRLTGREAAEIVRLAKNDSRFRYLDELWSSPETELIPPIWIATETQIRRKVVAWMDRHHEGHSARCLFTGES